MKITFFNHFNHGDIHISRGFVKFIKEKFSDNQCSFAHAKNEFILKDLNILCERDCLKTIDIYESSKQINDVIFCNTWYASNNRKYISEYGISFDCLYFLYDEFLRKHFATSFEELSVNVKDLFPIIDFEKFNIQKTREWINNEKRKKILVVNGHCLSGQSHNFILCDLIKKIARNNKDCVFVLTNDENNGIGNIRRVELENVIYSSSITKLDFDLNEVGYLSTFCDLIIGRATGPFTFACNQKNFFERKCQMLCLSNLVPEVPGKFWLNKKFQNKIDYSSDIEVTNESNLAVIEKMIENKISKIF